MTRANTTKFIIEADDYFAAHLDDGGIRIGFVGGTCFDFPFDHAKFSEIANLNPENIEGAYDDIFGSSLAE